MAQHNSLAFLLVLLRLTLCASLCGHDIYSKSAVEHADNLYNDWIAATWQGVDEMPRPLGEYGEAPQFVCGKANVVAAKAQGASGAPVKVSNEFDRVCNKGGYNEAWNFIPIINVCNTSLTIIGKNDEARRACGLRSLQLEPAGSKPCVIISIGCNNQWEFESHIFRTTRCRVETFDCTMPPGGRWTPPSEIRSRVRLHNICLASHNYTAPLPATFKRGNSPRKFLGYQSMLEYLELEHAPAMLKMDCERCEFDVLPALLAEGRADLLPAQLMLEVHPGPGPPDGGNAAARLTALVQQLYIHGSYFIMHRFKHNSAEALFARASCHQENGMLLANDNNATALARPLPIVTPEWARREPTAPPLHPGPHSLPPRVAYFDPRLNLLHRDGSTAFATYKGTPKHPSDLGVARDAAGLGDVPPPAAVPSRETRP